MLLTTLTMIVLAQVPAPSIPVQPVRSEVSPEAHQTPHVQPSPNVQQEVLQLGQGKVVGRVLKETQDMLYVDIGFDVLRVPLAHVVRRSLEGGDQASQIIAEEIFYRAQRPEVSIPEGAADMGEAVVKVESPAGQGSGFVAHPDGYVVTNFHVVEKEREVDVTFYLKGRSGFDLRTIRKCKVLAINPAIDLALVKVEPPDGMKFKHVYLGETEKVKVGEQVYAIGTPIGLERTVSAGIISVTNRVFGGHTMFQITTPINPGNSGGPLFNLRAEVVGVNSAGYMGLQGLNFAIPSKYVMDFLRNRDAFALDTTKSENGIIYLPAPRKLKTEAEINEWLQKERLLKDTAPISDTR